MRQNSNKTNSSAESTTLPAPTNKTPRKPAEPNSNESNHAIHCDAYINFAGIENIPDSCNISQPSNTLSQYLYPSPPIQFETQESILSDYYFSVICPINSCFDSLCNPLRSYVGAIMYTYPLIFQCVMAMSAAHLFQKRAEMINVVLDHRKAAISLLTSEMESETSKTTKGVSLLGSILLGMTSVSARSVDFWCETNRSPF